MRTLAHISDLHFGRTDPAIVAALLLDLAAARPDLIVVSGDLTQSAHVPEFEEARAFLDRLAAPYLVVPGNHDVPPYNLARRFVTPYGRYKRIIAPVLCPMMGDAEMVVVGINTARRFIWRWNWALGSISPAQIRRGCAVLAAAPPGVFKIVVTHHPFLPPPDAPDTDLVARAPEALRAFEAVGVDLMLAGHLHRSYSGLAPAHAAIHSSILVVQASTATSTRVREEPNAWNKLRIAPGPDGPTLELTPRVWTGTGFADGVGARFARVDATWRTEAVGTGA